MVVSTGTIRWIVLDQRDVNRRSVRSGTNPWARNIHCTTVNGMSGTRPHLAVQGETGTAQQNHPNRFLCLLSSAYADSFTGSTSVTPACSEPLLKKSLTVHQITYKIPICRTDIETERRQPKHEGTHIHCHRPQELLCFG